MTKSQKHVILHVISQKHVVLLKIYGPVNIILAFWPSAPNWVLRTPIDHLKIPAYFAEKNLLPIFWRFRSDKLRLKIYQNHNFQRVIPPYKFSRPLNSPTKQINTEAFMKIPSSNFLWYCKSLTRRVYIKLFHVQNLHKNFHGVVSSLPTRRYFRNFVPWFHFLRRIQI